MNRSEKLNFTLSLVAILVSVVTPFVTYFWLDASQKDYLDRAIFIIQNSDEDISRAQDVSVSNYSVSVKNIGNKYAENIKIFVTFEIRDNGSPKFPSRPFFIRDAFDYDLKTIDNFIVVTLNTPIPQNKVVTFNFDTGVSNAYLVTKYGDTLSLWGRGGLGGGAGSD